MLWFLGYSKIVRLPNFFQEKSAKQRNQRYLPVQAIGCMWCLEKIFFMRALVPPH